MFRLAETCCKKHPRQLPSIQGAPRSLVGACSRDVGAVAHAEVTILLQTPLHRLDALRDRLALAPKLLWRRHFELGSRDVLGEHAVDVLADVIDVELAARVVVVGARGELRLQVGGNLDLEHARAGRRSKFPSAR